MFLQHFGWSGAALISPSVLLILGTTFFASCLLAQAAQPTAAAAAVPTAAAAAAPASGGLLSSMPAGVLSAVQQWMSSSSSADAAHALSAVALATGAATNIAAGACRHSLFTPSKEMVYKVRLCAHCRVQPGRMQDLLSWWARSSSLSFVPVLMLAEVHVCPAVTVPSAWP